VSALPRLTSDGIQRLIDQLSHDVDKVSAPGVTDEQTLNIIKSDFEAARDLLLKAKMAPDPAEEVGTWSPVFKQLTDMLKQPLGLTAQDIGACRYKGGCAVMSSMQCTALGGSFKAGLDCNGAPL
jgi:hypothetical protein